jgi:hypothetical protein
MPANNRTTVFLSGKVHWVKVFGPPRMNYQGDAKEWTFEFEPDAEGVKILKSHKLGDRFKTKDGRPPFLSLKQSELRKDGTPNQPIRVYNAANEPWEPSILIGNESEADVKLDIRDYGPGKKTGVYPVAIRVTTHIPYVSSEFGGMDAKAAPKKGAKKASTFEEDFDLDDDLPDTE